MGHLQYILPKMQWLKNFIESSITSENLFNIKVHLKIYFNKTNSIVASEAGRNVMGT